MSNPSYGTQSWGIIKRFLYVVTPQLSLYTKVPFTDYENYDGVINSILVPEIVAFLVSQDYDCSVEDGYHMAWLSDSYGSTEFPFSGTCRIQSNLSKEDSRLYRNVVKNIEMFERPRKESNKIVGVVNDKTKGQASRTSSDCYPSNIHIPLSDAEKK